jgi:hypothetical protein
LENNDILTQGEEGQAMRISFDLDEVLFVNPENFKIEPPGLQETGQNEKEGNSKGTVKNTVVIRARKKES